MIRISALSKTYRDAAAPVLADVDLHVPAGCAFGLLGPNGAGKTTLLSIMAGLLPRDAGRIWIDGVDLDHDPREVRRRIGYVPQSLAFYPGLSVVENLRLYAALVPGRAAASLEFAIEATRLGEHLRTRAANLSGGLQRRLNLAIGLLGSPRLLCLDEPTAGVDPQARHFLIETVRRLRDEGMTILYTSHYMEEIERACDRIAVLHHGRIVAQGDLRTLLQESGGSLEALFLRLTASDLTGEAR